MLRRTIERLSRGRVLRRSVATEHGRFALYVSPDAQLKYLKPGSGAFDADLVRIADRMIGPGDVVWDVGANVGVFGFAAAARGASTVLMVEADGWLCTVLRRSAGLADHAARDMRILCAAVAAEDGIAEFMIAERGRASNALADAGGRSQMGGVRERVLVPTLTLDTIAATQPPPSFVKIDVEGAELQVLRGASGLMAAHRPIFYAEIGRDLFADCAALFAGAGYRCLDQTGAETSDPGRANYFFVHEGAPSPAARLA